MSIGFIPNTAVRLALALNLFAANAAVAPQQAAAAQQDASTDATPPATIARRPPALVPLYISLASLEALDVHSTFNALGRGGVEANPIMRPLAGSPAAVVAVKAAVTGVMIASTEKLWKKNRAAAILLMVGMNGAYAAVVAHNYSIAR